MNKNKCIYFILATIFISGCANENQENSNSVKYYCDGDVVVKEEFTNGHIITKSVFTKDTIMIKNRTEYYSNGEIEKWSYFNNVTKYPLFISYYDNAGNYMKFKGTPFIRLGTNKKGHVVVEIVNPPKISTILTYKELFQNTLQHQITYDPIKTDSSLWITLDEYEYISGHEYHLICKFLHKEVLVDSLSIEMEP